jgi:hypothetical protein
MATLFLAIAAVTGSAWSPPKAELFAGVSSRAMVTLVVEPRVVWTDGLWGRETTLGTRVEIPVLLVARGELDTIGFQVLATQEIAGGTPQVTHPGAEPAWSPSITVETGFGLDAHVQTLGCFRSLTATAGVDVGLSGVPGSVAVRTRWDQTVAAWWSPAARRGPTRTEGTEERIAGWLALDRGRLSAGVAAGGPIGPRVRIEGELLGVWALGPFVHGFGGMMVGQWPFSCMVGACMAPVTANR